MKQNLLIRPLLFLAMLLIVITGCDIDDDDTGKNEPQTGTFTDSRDGTVYQTVTIGDQEWLAENLRFLPSVVGPDVGSESTPYYYVHVYNGTNVTDAKSSEFFSAFGVLYNWSAAINACPAGWHLPSDDEWTELENFLADNEYNYDGTIGGGKTKIAKSLAATNGWKSSTNTGSVGNSDYLEYRNKSGFSALPGASRGEGGSFSYVVGASGAWWSATELNSFYAWDRRLQHDLSNVGGVRNDKRLGLSVRCVRD